MVTKLDKAIDDTVATSSYEYLVNNIEWEDGIKSKSGFTRFAKPMNYGDDPVVDNLIDIAVAKLTTTISDTKYALLGIYLNYYLDGSNYTPNHRHQGQTQIVISLGATRTLTVCSKKYPMSNGDIIMFGSSIHGVPKEPDIKDGRISIATFMKKL